MARMRAKESAGPPGGKATTRRVGCAAMLTLANANAVAKAPPRMVLRILFFMVCGLLAAGDSTAGRSLGVDV
ncbi:hypothetical protein D3C72_2215520 [compost metagenome]